MSGKNIQPKYLQYIESGCKLATELEVPISKGGFINGYQVSDLTQTLTQFKKLPDEGKSGGKPLKERKAELQAEIEWKRYWEQEPGQEWKASSKDKVDTEKFRAEKRKELAGLEAAEKIGELANAELDLRKVEQDYIQTLISLNNEPDATTRGLMEGQFNRQHEKLKEVKDKFNNLLAETTDGNKRSELLDESVIKNAENRLSELDKLYTAMDTWLSTLEKDMKEGVSPGLDLLDKKFIRYRQFENERNELCFERASLLQEIIKAKADIFARKEENVSETEGVINFSDIENNISSYRKVVTQLENVIKDLPQETERQQESKKAVQGLLESVKTEVSHLKLRAGLLNLKQADQLKQNEIGNRISALFTWIGDIISRVYNYFSQAKLEIEDQKAKYALTPEYSRAIFKELRTDLKESTPVEIKNPNGSTSVVIVDKQCWLDLERQHIQLIDNKDLIDIRFTDNYLKENESKTKDDWKKEQISILRGFCGYNENEVEDSPDNVTANLKLFMLTRKLNQSFPGAAYMCKDNVDCPQKFKGDFFVPLDNYSKLDRVYTISKDSQNDYTLTCEVKGTIGRISVPNKGIWLPTVINKSIIDERIGIVLKADNTWEEYTKGYFKCNIVDPDAAELNVINAEKEYSNAIKDLDKYLKEQKSYENRESIDAYMSTGKRLDDQNSIAKLFKNKNRAPYDKRMTSALNNLKEAKKELNVLIMDADRAGGTVELMAPKERAKAVHDLFNLMAEFRNTLESDYQEEKNESVKKKKLEAFNTFTGELKVVQAEEEQLRKEIAEA